MNKVNLNKSYLVELGIIVIFSMLPLLAPEMPYRVNIYLSWEGAYRLYEGQIPFKDFGLPMGFIYWVIPALFFKIFGPYLITLIKAQAFINIISGVALRSILKSFQLKLGERIICLMVFGLSYIMFNYWPWYNHSVIVYEIIALSILLKFAFVKEKREKLTFLIIGAIFIFLTFFTKQDGGGMAFMIGLGIVAYIAIYERKYYYVLVYLSTFITILIITVFSFKNYDFGYWFNYGQPPHYSRVSIADILEDFLRESFFEKFYFGIMVLILLTKNKSLKNLFLDKKEFLITFFCFTFFLEALIFQVTSYVPANSHIFFHSIAFIYIISFLGEKLMLDKKWHLLTYCFLLLLWWSSPHWRLISPIYAKIPFLQKKEAESIVSKNSYIFESDSVKRDNIPWESSNKWDVFKSIKMPSQTISGIETLLSLPIVKKTGKNIKVLNMSELTPLAHIIGYEIPRSQRQPLWYHQGVGLFQREIDYLCEKITKGHYDLVLFEDIPMLNNFYPPEVKECLTKQYKLVNSFMAPRRNEPGVIQIFVK